MVSSPPPPVLPPDSLAAALWQASLELARVLNGSCGRQPCGRQPCGQQSHKPQSREPQLRFRDEDFLPGNAHVASRGAVKDIVFGALRRYGEGDALLSFLLRTPPPLEIRALLLCALFRLQTWSDAHTVVNQAVEAAGQWAGGRCKGLVNGVLRTFLRQREALVAALAPDSAATLWHPDWWLARLRTAWPGDWPRIVTAGNHLPPLGLRVNQRRLAAADYLARLQATGLTGELRGEAGIVLEKPVPVANLPGFAEGLVSVQDWGAQRAAELLDPPAGSRVLDACAAPGGKTAHLLERGDIDLTALDVDPQRCRLIGENLQRLGIRARVRCGDASMPHAWGRAPDAFDAILADVPCSASGVVRRHPDIKWLRRPQDIPGFARTQRRILERLWTALTPGGKFLYATCSVFPEENGEQIAKFTNRVPDARLVAEEHWLPGEQHDGFYYALLQKRI
ncbi:MAG: 16S rRNA (cytosine(967)-C(5))-methyltransferase RsmB [Zoogloeaceae bacterium]|jgi:16S rRNA (cytosine967-C5)-methyltransferase|nr:16S rRNA (cytosine(967)-C(5))-methyltransferase RsmB [Zoogloeaceae bacterium]